MRHLSRILLLVMCIGTLLSSCKKAKNISVNESQVTFSVAGGEKEVVVTADGGVDIQDCPEWLKANMSDSILTFTVERNTTGASRECTVRLVGDNTEVPVTVTQSEKCTHIDVTPAVVALPKEGGEVTLQVDTDGDKIAMQITDGVDAEYHPKNGQLIVRATPNAGGTIRGQLTLSCDDVTTRIPVTVTGSICPTCGGKGTIQCSRCRGNGSYWWDSYGNYVDGESGCERCGGYGVISSDGTPYGFRRGSGRVTCPTCGGSGH